MSNQTAFQLVEGQTLTLKPARADAYGMADPHVTFLGTETKGSYLTPWIVARDGAGQVGSYKPSDFC